MKTMTAGELIQALQDLDPDTLVVFSCNYGDYHRTQQALPIRGKFEEATLEKTAYSESGWALARQDEDEGWDEDDQEGLAVMVIR